MWISQEIWQNPLRWSSLESFKLTDFLRPLINNKKVLGVPLMEPFSLYGKYSASVHSALIINN